MTFASLDNAPPLPLADIVRTNLSCAVGLSGAESLDESRMLATIDSWTVAMRKYWEATSHNFANDRQRAEHAFLSLMTFLKHPRGLGIRYDDNAIGSSDFSDSRRGFVHGIVECRTGTCASLPVLFVAIARSLGWPLSLAVAKGHVLCQWVFADGSHVNCEGSCPGGGELYPDVRYYAWPSVITNDDRLSGRYLRPLTSNEEASLFLETRGHCLADNGRYVEAAEAYTRAARIAPAWSLAQGHIRLLDRLTR